MTGIPTAGSTDLGDRPDLFEAARVRPGGFVFGGAGSPLPFREAGGSRAAAAGFSPARGFPLNYPPMPKIHPSAIVEKSVQLHESVEIGPWCHVSGNVQLGAGVRLVGNVYIQGPVTVGEGTVIYPFACIGFEPQDVKFKPGMPTGGVQIGVNCMIREHVTIHCATKPDVPTTVGDRAFMMVNSHIGHDGRIGNDVTMVNASVIGGHAQIADRVLLGGNSAIHQFVRVGRLAMIGGDSSSSLDVPPFLVGANRNNLAGINLIGMRRSGMDRNDITAVREAYRSVFKPGLMREQMLARLAELGKGSPAVMEMHEFVRTAKRPLLAHASSRDLSGGEQA
jgi:UDP-N-acetylglucosamine acyltransferase